MASPCSGYGLGMTSATATIKPKTPGGRFVNIIIGLVGLIFTGITVALASRALAATVRQQSGTKSDSSSGDA